MFPKVIAFYLPQFHPIPENNEWWGRGFTEWTNVVKAKPLFAGHNQPHLPADLGFYDLRLAETRAEQAEMAQAFGVHGFCYYHYWFNGKRLLDRPVSEIVQSGSPSFPFCLCWANENWTRRWDGHENEVLIAQNYSEEDDLAHIRSLVKTLSDSRYIRVKGVPILLVYQSELMPDSQRTTDCWRREAERAGLGGLYLVRVERFNELNPLSVGFDASVEFQPFAPSGSERIRRFRWWRRRRLGTQETVFRDHKIFSYASMVSRSIARTRPGYPLIRSVTPSWDNSARRSQGAMIFHGSSPRLFESWVSALSTQMTQSASDASNSLLFVNAWNEWAEGNHMEPCQQWGRAYLEALKRGLQGPSQSTVNANE
jgi:hypothetical protein